MLFRIHLYSSPFCYNVMNSKTVGLSNKRSYSTIVGLVAAIAVLSGGLGLAMTDAFEVSKTGASAGSSGFIMGHLEIEAHNADGELVAYRQTDNEVVDGGEQCILKMLFATTGGQLNAATEQGRGEYASTGVCTGILRGAWDVIAIGTAGETGLLQPAHDLYSGLQEECSARLAGDCPAGIGLNRALATTKTWTNGSGGTDTKIELKNTFTSTGTASITESGLFNSTTIASGGMLAHQTFTAVSLTSGDSITVTWTFTVGN